MKKKVKRLFFIISIYITVFFSLSGCWSKRELNELSIVTGIGIDKADGPENILVTAQIVKPADIKKPSKDGNGGSDKAFWNIKTSSQTVFDAIREFTHETSNKLYVAHTQVIIFGKDIAPEGVQKYLDFFMRSHETRPTTIILVSDSTAGEVLDVKPETEKLPAMNIAKLAKNQGLLTAHAIPVNLQEFTARLLSKTTSPIAPIVTVTNTNGKKTLHVEGTAVFKKDKMAGTLSPDETRGLLWITGKVKSGDIDLDLPDGKATMEIVGSEGKVTPQIKNNKPYVSIYIKASTNMVNQTSKENLATMPGFSRLKKYQEDVIKDEIRAVLKKAKGMNTDIFGFGDIFKKKFKSKWKTMEDNWDKEFPDLQVEIKIESKIQASGLIIRPAVPESQPEKE
ncbi:MAG TPA: Ger(x)C family spore germination protein [Clostridia bacterium]|nr:Ger(x)C family spore germination protein [Clostridia bacterium]